MTKTHEEMILAANLEIEKNRNAVSRDADRCKLHFMAPTGWMNDPNGLTFYKGEYHVFYQYNPYSAMWGPMHWGHAKSTDLINWTHLPVALAPSEPYEKGGGCFSGSAVVCEDELNVFYTAAFMDRESGRHAQTQCRAFGTDGIKFFKDEKNPLIPVPPEGYSLSFRDPKVWRHEKQWYMVVGGMKDDKGQIFLYSSSDLKRWRFCTVLAQSDGEMGFMWECPDFFFLDGKYVLLFSPMIKDGDRTVGKTMYITGSFDYSTYNFAWEKTGQLDLGDEFYAPQSFLDREGRRTVFGWLNTWNFSFGTKDVPEKTADKKWCGSFSLPRVLSVSPCGELASVPHPSVRAMNKQNIVSLKGARVKTVCGEMFANGVSCYAIKAEFVLARNKAGFGILFGGGEKEKAAAWLAYDPTEGTVTLKRKASPYYKEHFSQGVMSAENGQLSMEIYVDGPVIESYMQNGQMCITAHADPELMQNGFSFFTDSEAVKIISLSVVKL